MTSPLFLIHAFLFVVGTVFVVWLAVHVYNKSPWYLLAFGLPAMVYEVVIGLCLPLSASQFYAIIPMIIALGWVAGIKIKWACS